jgi:DnaJ family protein C protein 28
MDPMDQRNRQSWLEKTIKEAQERGLFDNLDGTGRPINWEDESLVDKEWAMAFRIMREQGFAPEWIELHKEISAELKQARETVLRTWKWRQERAPAARGDQRRNIDTEWQRARAAFTESIAELNAKIDHFNLLVPIPRLQKAKLALDEELLALGIVQ